MKQQIVAVHGGNSFKTYEDYIEYLKDKELSLKKLKPRDDWKDNLQKDLGENFEVLLPRMPDSNNAKYLEWKIWFEKILDITEDKLILIGHSLGGMFLVKYFSENIIDKRIKAMFIISTPFKSANKNDENIRFAHTGDLNNITKQCENVYFLHSKDDDVIDFEDFEKYKAELPNANFIEFEDKGHFTSESFPEIIELINEIN